MELATEEDQTPYNDMQKRREERYDIFKGAFQIVKKGGRSLSSCKLSPITIASAIRHSRPRRAPSPAPPHFLTTLALFPSHPSFSKSCLHFTSHCSFIPLELLMSVEEKYSASSWMETPCKDRQQEGAIYYCAVAQRPSTQYRSIFLKRKQIERYCFIIGCD